MFARPYCPFHCTTQIVMQSCSEKESVICSGPMQTWKTCLIILQISSSCGQGNLLLVQGRDSTGRGTSTQMKSDLTAVLMKLQPDSYLPRDLQNAIQSPELQLNSTTTRHVLGGSGEKKKKEEVAKICKRHGIHQFQSVTSIT